METGFGSGFTIMDRDQAEYRSAFRFVRAIHKEALRGTGIGLAIVRNQSTMEAKLEMESNGRGESSD